MLVIRFRIVLYYLYRYSFVLYINSSILLTRRKIYSLSSLRNSKLTLSSSSLLLALIVYRRDASLLSSFFNPTAVVVRFSPRLRYRRIKKSSSSESLSLNFYKRLPLIV